MCKCYLYCMHRVVKSLPVSALASSRAWRARSLAHAESVTRRTHERGLPLRDSLNKTPDVSRKDVAICSASGVFSAAEIVHRHHSVAYLALLL